MTESTSLSDYFHVCSVPSEDSDDQSYTDHTCQICDSEESIKVSLNIHDKTFTDSLFEKKIFLCILCKGSTLAEMVKEFKKITISKFGESTDSEKLRSQLYFYINLSIRDKIPYDDMGEIIDKLLEKCKYNAETYIPFDNIKIYHSSQKIYIKVYKFSLHWEKLVSFFPMWTMHNYTGGSQELPSFFFQFLFYLEQKLPFLQVKMVGLLIIKIPI